MLITPHLIILFSYFCEKKTTQVQWALYIFLIHILCKCLWLPFTQQMMGRKQISSLIDCERRKFGLFPWFFWGLAAGLQRLGGHGWVMAAKWIRSCIPDPIRSKQVLRGGVGAFPFRRGRGTVCVHLITRNYSLSRLCQQQKTTTTMTTMTIMTTFVEALNCKHFPLIAWTTIPMMAGMGNPGGELVFGNLELGPGAGRL